MNKLIRLIEEESKYSKDKSNKLGEVIWKDIIDYEHYEISNSGLIRNKKSHRPITPIVANDFYIHIRLTKNKNRKHFLYHRLIAIHFIDNPKKLKYVDHIDRDKNNNCISNLRWISMRGNLLNKEIKKTSKYAGTSFDKHTNKWESNIMEKGKRYRLGRFKTEIEAAKAYDNKLLDLGLNKINFEDE